ncbi:MAG TPA: quinone-dependent dihydroorotate dehydrogenase [Gammaproteobacteria bacterium]|mgnify:CR=1 FL=1|nr:quinone-dependent dihydroorotate dehydrogenase [Gammaproteobacteria bacterium]
MAGLYSLTRPLLFQLEPEIAHRLTLAAIRTLGRIHPLNQYVADLCRGSLPAIPVEAMGLFFPNPVGLAAGLDKHAEAVDGLAALGFGFLELGTVTPLPQAGNPRPRVFRLSGAQALINRMGFNSEGLNQFLTRLGQHQQQAIIGINLGRNAATGNQNAWRDYLTGLRAVYRIADYVTINISSPNTEGLRDLQEHDILDRLLQQLKDEQRRLADLHSKYTPIAVKISPDLNTDGIGQIAEVLIRRGIDGIVATNTTITRPLDADVYPQVSQTGGLSGAPLAILSHRVITELRQHTPPSFPIIAVGGIMDAASAQAALSAGATLIQLYSGLIYRGPALVREILRALEAADAAGR